MIFVNLFYIVLLLCIPLWNRIDVGRLLQSRYKLILFSSGHPLGWPEVMERWLLCSQGHVEIFLCFYSIIALEELPFRNPQSCHRLTGGIVISSYFRLCRSRPTSSSYMVFFRAIYLYSLSLIPMPIIALNNHVAMCSN